jgi:hypothetical protein
MLETQLKFQERYYRWALQDWEREIAEDFPLLRSIRDNNARLAIRLMIGIKSNQRLLLAKALTKRFRKPILAQWGDTFTEEDKRFEKLFMDELSQGSSLEPTYPNVISPEPLKLKREQLKHCLVRALSPALGENYEDWGNWKVWKYSTIIGAWQVITYFDIGGRFHQLSYAHEIMSPEQVYLARSISILGWFGISSQVMLQGLDDSDAKPTATALAKIIKHFMNVAPKLLEGLSPD